MTRTIPDRESLTVEFKSDRNRLSDRDLVTVVVCLANTDGGEIYLGVEKDGAVTGPHPEHQNLATLAALIANRTSPPVSVHVTDLQEAGKTIARKEQTALQYLRTQGRITRSQAAELCRLGSEQAKRLLTRMEEKGLLVQKAMLKAAYYERAPNI